MACDLETRASRPPPLLAGVPETAAARLKALLSEEFPREDLAAAVHVQRFVMDAVTNNAIDLSRVLEAQRLCEALLAAHGLDDEARRLAEAAVRYFVLSDDGAWDFTANGLDDDLAILRAVAARVTASTVPADDARAG